MPINLLEGLRGSRQKCAMSAIIALGKLLSETTDRVEPKRLVNRYEPLKHEFRPSSISKRPLRRFRSLRNQVLRGLSDQGDNPNGVTRTGGPPPNRSTARHSRRGRPSNSASSTAEATIGLGAGSRRGLARGRPRGSTGSASSASSRHGPAIGITSIIRPASCAAGMLIAYPRFDRMARRGTPHYERHTLFCDRFCRGLSGGVWCWRVLHQARTPHSTAARTRRWPGRGAFPRSAPD